MMTKCPVARDDSMELDLLWISLGRLALRGKVSLRVTRMACSVLLVVASYRRHGENKTQAAIELGSSRRVIRELIARWDGYDNAKVLLEELRRELKPKQDDERGSSISEILG